MNFRFPRHAAGQALVAPPKAIAGALGRRIAQQAHLAMPAYRAPAAPTPDAGRRYSGLSLACRTLAKAATSDMAAISVTGALGHDAEAAGAGSLRAVVNRLAQEYGFSAELQVDNGSFTVRFSRG